MKTSSVIRALAVGISLGLCAGLGCGPATCTPDNCSGCCDEAGQCRAGNTAAACGLGGSECISCGASVCKADGTCFLTADGSVPVLLDDGGFPVTEDGGWVEDDAGLEVDAGGADAGDDAGAPDAGVDAGQPDAGEDGGLSDAGMDAGMDAGSDAGMDAGIFLPRDNCDVPVDVSGLDAGAAWADRPFVDFQGGRVLLSFNAHRVSSPSTRTLQTRLYENGTWGPTVSHVTDTESLLWQDDELTLDPQGNAAIAWAPGTGNGGRRVYARATDTWVSVPWTSAPLSGERLRLFWTGPSAFFHGWFGNSTPLFATASLTGFTTDQPVTSATGQATELAAARMVDGDVAVVWLDTNRVFRGRFIEAGALKMGGEASIVEPATVGFIGRPAVGALPSGDALVVWERRNNSGTVELMGAVLRDDVTQPLFDSPVALAQTTSSQSYGAVQVLVDGNGDVTVTWLDLDNSTWALRRVAGTWGTPVQLGAKGLAFNRRAVLDAFGHVTVATFNNSSAFRVQLRRIAQGSSTWGPAYFATPNTTGAAALALTAAGEPMVFYRESSAASPILMTTCR